mmetsp:Transcript_14448/g.36925  ORF Transcript_14448/g.36925 Transcript_14448/m.36925 type:complete len:436 (-) Transcript_14448:129-1436(-)
MYSRFSRNLSSRSKLQPNALHRKILPRRRRAALRLQQAQIRLLQPRVHLPRIELLHPPHKRRVSVHLHAMPVLFHRVHHPQRLVRPPRGAAHAEQPLVSRDARAVAAAAEEVPELEGAVEVLAVGRDGGVEDGVVALEAEVGGELEDLRDVADAGAVGAAGGDEGADGELVGAEAAREDFLVDARAGVEVAAARGGRHEGVHGVDVRGEAGVFHLVDDGARLGVVGVLAEGVDEDVVEELVGHEGLALAEAAPQEREVLRADAAHLHGVRGQRIALAHSQPDQRRRREKVPAHVVPAHRPQHGAALRADALSLRGVRAQTRLQQRVEGDDVRAHGGVREARAKVFEGADEAAALAEAVDQGVVETDVAGECGGAEGGELPEDVLCGVGAVLQEAELDTGGPCDGVGGVGLGDEEVEDFGQGGGVARFDAGSNGVA